MPSQSALRGSLSFWVPVVLVVFNGHQKEHRSHFEGPPPKRRSKNRKGPNPLVSPTWLPTKLSTTLEASARARRSSTLRVASGSSGSPSPPWAPSAPCWLPPLRKVGSDSAGHGSTGVAKSEDPLEFFFFFWGGGQF